MKSRVATQRYGLQLNMNLLGFFTRTKDSRWSLDISPALSAIGTESSIRTIADGSEAVKGNTRWHLGAGGNMEAGYMLTRNLHIGIYSGITYLTGDAMDGLPEYRHKNNFTERCRNGSSGRPYHSGKDKNGRDGNHIRNHRNGGSSSRLPGHLLPIQRYIPYGERRGQSPSDTRHPEHPS